MIQLFHRDACARPACKGRRGRHERTAWRSLENRDIASSSFLSRPFRREGIRQGASLEPMEEPSWFGTIRNVRLNPLSGSQRGGASDVRRLPER